MNVSWTAGQPISITSSPCDERSTRCRISGGCNDAVAGLQPERRALVLVHEVDPAAGAEDHLEPDPVEVHGVGDVAAAGDADVRGDEPAAAAIGQEVAVLHAGATDAEPVVVVGLGRPDERERRRVVGQVDRRPSCDEVDAGPVRCGQRLSRPARSAPASDEVPGHVTICCARPGSRAPGPERMYVDGSSAGEIVSMRSPSRS